MKILPSTIASIALAACLGLPGETAPRAVAGPEEADAARKASRSSVADLSRAFKEAARTVRPSVVNISSLRIIRPSNLKDIPDIFGSPSDDEALEDFFRRFFQQRAPRDGVKQTGMGTGVVMTRDGHILTNNHVVANASELTVKLSPGREVPAKVVGADPETDLAVIKVDVQDLQPARLGDSDSLEQGEWVLAMGNALGLNETLTAGIVSAKGRANIGIVDYEDFIQTDAAINPGNSGGPLFNLEGEVMGINTAIFSRSGGFMGIGFAIPIKMAREVMDAILKEGRVVRGQLGVNVQDLTPGLARSFGFEAEKGALVAAVPPGSPADRAGIRPGDIVVSVNGTPIEDSLQLRNLVASLRPGSEAQVEVFRQGKRETLKVEVGERESQEKPGESREAAPATLGMRVRTLTPEVARTLGLKDLTEGVVLLAVEPGSRADKAGLQPKDVITAVGDAEVSDVDEFQREVEKRMAQQEGVRLKVRRGPSNLYLFIEPDKN